jgi:hypothetical protein
VAKTLSEWADSLQADVERVGHTHVTKPDDDWLPMCWLESYTGEGIVLGLSWEMFASEESKDRLDEMLYKAAISASAVRAAVLVNAWAIESTDDVEGVQPRDNPKRIELLMLNVLDLDETISRSATIHRHEGSRPTLSEWEEADFVEGRQLNPLRLAMAHIRGMAEDPMGLLDGLARRAAEKGDEEALAAITAARKLAQSDPEYLKMPIAEWFKGRQR